MQQSARTISTSSQRATGPRSFSLASRRGAKSFRPLKVIAFPKDPNPYQRLLYTPMQRHRDVEVKYLATPTRFESVNLALLPLQLARNRLRGYQVFHLHWTWAFKLPGLDNWAVKLLMQYYCILTMHLVSLFGYRLVWTAHDYVPHSPNFLHPERVNRSIGRLADVLIVHSPSAIEQLRGIGVHPKKVAVVPIGNYIGVYSSQESRPEARSRLNVAPRDLVVLFFGLIRPYKGVDALIRAFTTVGDRGSRLIIAGRCRDPRLREELERLCDSNLGIDFYEGHVDDSEVASYFAACDLVCLPFRTITTSSSAILALSFGRPLVAPRIGALVDLPDNVGWFYDPVEADGLERALCKALSERDNLETYGHNALEYAKSFPWDAVADQTYAIYREVLLLHPTGPGRLRGGPRGGGDDLDHA